MKKEQDYIRDITEIRSMMEKSSKFMSLSGWAGIMAGIYALSAAYIAYFVYGFSPDEIIYESPFAGSLISDFSELMILALIVLAVSLFTAIFFSWRTANVKGDKIWNTTSKRLLSEMAIPFITGGILIIIFVLNNLIGLIAPAMLLFYGLALISASRFTIVEVKFLGLIQIALGLISAYFIAYGLLFWAIGFGIAHMVYGIYMYFRYER
jgi:hypothetical protein